MFCENCFAGQIKTVVNSNLLYKYLEVFKKYGIIINDLSKNVKSLQIEKLLIKLQTFDLEASITKKCKA